MSTSPPAAWYPDPSGVEVLRWWDGTHWTDHTAPLPSGGAVAVPTAGQQTQAGGTRRMFDKLANLARNQAQQAGTGNRPVVASGAYGHPTPPWSEQLRGQDIVGESFHVDSFRKLAKEYGHKAVPPHGLELNEARASVVPDPDNPHDSTAVAVWIDGRHLVGHLPRGVAHLYFDRLSNLDAGTHLQVPARVWIGWREEFNDRTGEVRRVESGSVTVKLPEPAGIAPFNDLPLGPFTVLPWGRATQISGEEKHMDVLRTFALGSEPRHVAATLHVAEEEKRGGEMARLVEVRLDGQKVGTMTKATSEQIADLVQYVAEKGREPVARAIVKGSDLRAEVVVHVARTSEVSHRWLDSVQPVSDLDS